MKRILRSLCLALILTSASCQQATKNETNTVTIRERTDAATLNPVAASDQLSFYLGMHLFQTLTNIDYKSEELVGVLATKPPKIEYDSTEYVKAIYELRENARFNQNQQVSFEDILFSLKLNICPLVSNGNGRDYYNFIEDIQKIDSESFYIKYSGKSVLNELRCGDFTILPRFHYDSLNLLQNFSIQRLKSDTSLVENDSIKRFAEAFNASLTSTSSSDYVGSGSYTLKKWQKGERIILERKEGWWGNNYSEDNTFLIANADEIQFEVINDNQTAINALKAGEIDVLNYVGKNDFDKINDHKEITTLQCSQHGYNYIGFNCNHPILRNREFRKAIEAAIPFQKIIEVVFQNQGELNRLPLALQQTELRNNEILFEGQNLEKAKEILSDLNWEDSNNNGTLDKEIDGELMECKLEYFYNSGNEERKAVGYLLKNELEKINISLEVKELEWVTYLKALKNNEIPIFMSGKLTLPITPDFTSALHSSSANGGRNYANYQNSSLDSLIDRILIEPNEVARIKLVKSAQEIIAKDAPYIYLLSTKNRFAHSNRLKNVPVYSIRPHFWAPEIY